MKLRRALIFLSIWFLLPLLSVVYLAVSGIRPDVKSLKESLDAYRPESHTSSELLDELPRYFDKFPHTAVVILAGEQGSLLGSMYESNRISETSYDELLGRFRSGKFDPAAPFAGLLNFLPVTYKAAGTYTIYFLMKQNLYFNEYWLYTRRKVPSTLWFLTAYLVAGILISIGILFIGKDRTKSILENVSYPTPQYDAKPTLSKPASLVAIQPAFFENQLLSLLTRLEQFCLFSRVTYYSYERNNWQPFLQKRGAITVRGAALNPVPEILDTLSARTSWDNPICNTNRDEAILPVKRKGELLGALYLTAANMAPFSEELLHQVRGEIAMFARGLFIQRTFEAATLDEETGLFTYPYFYLALKERLLAGRPFATAFFEIKEIERTSAATLARWAKQISQLSQSASNIIARLDQNRFAIIFDFSLTKYENDLEATLQICHQIRDKSRQLLLSPLTGALVPRGNDLTSIDAYLKRLERALAESRQTGEFNAAIHSAPRAVL